MITREPSSGTYEIYADFNHTCYRDSKNHDIWKDVDMECLKTSIRNILMTVRGTRRMLPEFGANLEEKLFEPMDYFTSYDIGNRILQEIERWDPDVDIKNVSVIGDEDKHLYEVEITYDARTASINTSSIKFILEQR